MTVTKKETVIEADILTYLNVMPNMFAWKNKTMGVYDPVIKAYRKSNNKHVYKGVPDIIGVCNGKFIAIEVKTEKGVVSKDQKKFIERLSNHGARVLVARSLSDVRKWFKENREDLYGNSNIKELSD